jgi:hypothetical protein
MKTREFYRAATASLDKASVPFLVGGAYAFARYTGIERHTKDFDIFVRETDASSALAALAAAGYQTELTFPHWLGKAYCDGDFIDVIYSSGNGVAVVDDGWFEHSIMGEVLGREMRLCPVEEMIWSKAFVVERERYDGADICHLIKACGPTMDWARLMRRFDRNWRVLMSHLVLFGFVYPSERGVVPKWVMQELLDRTKEELDTRPPEERVCQGTLLSRAQYLVDIQKWGYEDARLREDVHMNPDDIAHWTAAIEGATANYVERKGTGSAGRGR